MLGHRCRTRRGEVRVEFDSLALRVVAAHDADDGASTTTATLSTNQPSSCQRHSGLAFGGSIVSFFNASHAALCTARHGVRSYVVPVALVGECSLPLV